ncbi:hypothetical protein [Mesorhizobium sp. B2-3-10]|uniref:hypothetical protein n=1 Tax=Mesorhizobium sp. B2-3-10 TaxID=2589954 RepID=UPI00112DE705|nr:hypothetical protein [Mesorhizobium sp. B2-3-10]TPL98307.1 hypothetical protein FJ943_15495 [Mesorhizobium sp. B2-3-10]
MKLETVQCLAEGEPLRLLQAEVDADDGNQTTAAARLGLSPSLVNATLRGAIAVGPRVLSALGLEARRVIIAKPKGK